MFLSRSFCAVGKSADFTIVLLMVAFIDGRVGISVSRARDYMQLLCGDGAEVRTLCASGTISAH